MWIVAIAWIYVVGLMAVTESSIVAGIMTFVGYCAIPLSILLYLTGGKRRRARRERANSQDNDADTALFSGSYLAGSNDTQGTSDASDNKDCNSDSASSSDSSSCSDSGGSDSSSD
jgi:hypothetical protein